MGNKFCKKRVDTVDGTATAKGPKRFDRIINKLNLKPKWKSDSNLEEKPVQISTEINQKSELSKSSEWVDVPLEVPANNNRIKTIFNDNSTPTPPPRKQQSKRIIDTVKKAFKSNTTPVNAAPEEEQEPIVEEVMVKKTINYNCPCGGDHLRGQHDKVTAKAIKEIEKRSKSPSVASLPNYNDLKLSVAPSTDNKNESKEGSAQSLPDEGNNNNNNNHNRKSSSTERIESYLTRARSFGSLLPAMLLHKLTTSKAPLAEIESDDSLGGMDDWGGLNMIEHYTPKDSSLPRPSRKKTDAEILAGIEGLIVDDQVDVEKPVPPTRKSESMVKKIHKDIKSSKDGGTPPPTPEENYIKDKDYNACSEKNVDGDCDRSRLMDILHELGESKKDFNNDFLNAERSHIYRDITT